MARKPEDERRTRPIFVRVSPKEMRVIEAAIRAKYGEVDGFINAFARRAMLLYAKQILKQVREREG